jgi:hypothetical protein
MIGGFAMNAYMGQCCQILLRTTYQNGGYIPKCHKIYQSAIKYTKMTIKYLDLHLARIFGLKIYHLATLPGGIFRSIIHPFFAATNNVEDYRWSPNRRKIFLSELYESHFLLKRFGKNLRLYIIIDKISSKTVDKKSLYGYLF